MEFCNDSATFRNHYSILQCFSEIYNVRMSTFYNVSAIFLCGNEEWIITSLFANVKQMTWSLCHTVSLTGKHHLILALCSSGFRYKLMFTSNGFKFNRSLQYLTRKRSLKILKCFYKWSGLKMNTLKFPKIGIVTWIYNGEGFIEEWNIT